MTNEAISQGLKLLGNSLENSEMFKGAINDLAGFNSDILRENPTFDARFEMQANLRFSINSSGLKTDLKIQVEER